MEREEGMHFLTVTENESSKRTITCGEAGYLEAPAGFVRLRRKQDINSVPIRMLYAAW